MEATETVSPPDHILEQIQYYNRMLNKSVLKKNHQDEKIMEYTPKLTPLLLGLIKTLRQKLEFTSKILQNTCQFLNTVHDNSQQEISCPEWEGLADWILDLSTHLLHVVEHLGQSEDELIEMSCRKLDDMQHAQDGCAKPASDKEQIDMQLQGNTNQLSPELSSLYGEESGTRAEENRVMELETIIPLKGKESDKEEECPVLVNSKRPNKSEELCMVPKKGNGVDSYSETSSANKIHENSSSEDIPGDTIRKIIVSRNLEDINANHLQMPPTQKSPGETKENLDEAENGNCNLTVKPGSLYEDFNQKHRNNEIAQSKEGCSRRSEDLHGSSSSALLIDKLEEEENECNWRSKEFFMDGNHLREPEVSCSVTAPCSILENLVIRVVNDLSPLVVDDAEELVSNVISAECSLFDQPMVSPIIFAIPFTSCYRGMYKDIMVKVTDKNFQSIYLTPLSLEGYQGNQKGAAAMVKTCQFAIFSVVSCLKKETLTIPRKGLSRKLNMDPRISFCYPPSTFSSRVSVQLKVQPIDQSILSILKTKHDVYHSVVATSPLVHLEHSSSLPFNKPVTAVLPCPPNQEKRREGIETDPGRATSASVPRITSVHHFRGLSASPRKRRENLTEPLKVLGYRNNEEGWVLVEDITVRNTRNGLVSCELDEPLERFIIVRLSSAMDNTHLIQFIQNLENAIHNIMVKVVLYQNKEDPYKIIVLLVPSKELNMELQYLHEEGYSGPPEPSKPFKMREGELVYFRFSGNIFASDDGKVYGKNYSLAFHAQRKLRLALQIKEMDEFGNYSSPHYKGTALFYKVMKEAILKNVEQPLRLEECEQDSFLCKLALTLPKKEKLISRPQSTKRISTDISEVTFDNLLYWLSEELSEENANSLALYLPLHRSTLQFIKLKCPDNLTEQIYELLCFWRRNLPRSADKLKLLSRYLCKSGRSDLAQILQFKWANQDIMKKIHW